MDEDVLSSLKRGLTAPLSAVYYIPGFTSGAPKRNVLLLLIYLLVGLLLANVVTAPM